MSITLTNEQREALLRVLGIEARRVREADLAIRELAERTALLVRAGDFATGLASLNEDDREPLAELLSKHRAEALEVARILESDLVHLEGGDPDYAICGCSDDESADWMRESIMDAWRDSGQWGGLLAALNVERQLVLA
jgi:hypothetical protein